MLNIITKIRVGGWGVGGGIIMVFLNNENIKKLKKG